MAIEERAYTVVGKSVKKYDGLGHVTGATRYTDDLSFPGMLYAAIHRSPHPHARILNIDTSAAERLTGVRAVATHTDVPNNVHGLLAGAGVQADEPLLAEHEVCYVGQPIAAIAATDYETAREAAALVKVEYEPLPAILDPRESIKAGAPPVRTAYGVYPNYYIYAGHPCRRVRFGDYEAAIQQADVVLHESYKIGPIEQAPLETQASIAVPDGTGRLTVYSTTQALYFTMSLFAGMMGIPLSKIKFVGGTVGGGFGGKVDGATEPFTGLLALKCGKPVKYRASREDENLYNSVRGGGYVEITSGAMKDGWVIAHKVLNLSDTGAYNRTGPYGTNKNANHLGGPYAFPNVWIDSYCVYTNKQPTSAMRGFGVFEATYPIEVQMAKLSAKLGIDPWELRFKNALRTGDMNASREVLDSVALIETMQAAAQAAGVELTAEQRALSSRAR